MTVQHASRKKPLIAVKTRDKLRVRKMKIQTGSFVRTERKLSI